MTAVSADLVRQTIERLYRDDSRRVFATLVRLLGDFDLAEESMHEAFAAAFEQWARDGLPANPRAWLVSAGRFKAIDALRRRSRFDGAMERLARQIETPGGTAADLEDVEDDRLRLIFTCCHPGLSVSTQVALTLREVCGLSTEQIASAFLATPSTIAQRIVRGKAKIRDAGIPYRAPTTVDLPERLEAVLYVIYLVFSEGYSASSGETVHSADLSREAIRLGRLLVELQPDAEAAGLLSLMLFHESRRTARTDAAGDLILLEDQDRSLWSRELIEEAETLAARALSVDPIGVYAVQAAIAAEHARAPTAAATNWARIVGLYDLLLAAQPSPIVELNRAVALAMQAGPAVGLKAVDAILERGALGDYHLAHATKADLCRRLGRAAEARESYQRALSLARQGPERRFLEKRLAELA